MRAPRPPFSSDWLGLAAAVVAIGSILAAAWALLSEW
jgi:hypothetical protein